MPVHILTSTDAKDTLEGIALLACRRTKADAKDFRVKEGGRQRDNTARIDMYVSVQNADARINTVAAQELRLIRRSFMVWQTNEMTPAVLKMLEWHWEKDWNQDYREIWSQPYEDFKARQELAIRMADSIKELVQNQ